MAIRSWHTASLGRRDTYIIVVASLTVNRRQHGDVPIAVVSDHETFLAKVHEYEQEPELFIDIETADWWTPSPRVALLQVWAGREVTVFDVLATGMEGVLSGEFVPHIMANERVRKWAHNAAYEKRFLGGACVQNLSCTMRLARGVAFHRLPVESLSLASLVSALFGETVDKSLQKADWSVRPLSDEHCRYAAADTTWCAQLRTALEAIERPPSPEHDSPEAIDAVFPGAKLKDLTANAELKVLRESVRELMRREGLTRFSRFATWDAERLEVPLLAFVAEVERVDPARMLDLDTRVTKEKLDLLDGGVGRLLDACRTSQTTRFQMPRMQRPRGATLFYDVERNEAERVTRDYESRAREHRMASSMVDELKQRMRGVLELRGATSFGAWSHAPGLATRAIDVRDAVALAPSWANTMVPLTKKFQLAIGEAAVAALAPATNTKSSAVIRWCPRSDVVGIEALESRWWNDAEQDGEI